MPTSRLIAANHVVLTPIITSPTIVPYSWSPDSNMLAYWTFTAAEAKEWFKRPPGTLHFLNPHTGRACISPYPIGYRNSPLVWLSNGKILTVTDARAANPNQVFLGTPCTNDFTNLSQHFPDRVYGIAPYKPDDSQFVLSNKQGYWLYTPQTQTVRRMAATVPNVRGIISGSPSGEHFTLTSTRSKNNTTTSTTYVIELSTD